MAGTQYGAQNSGFILKPQAQIQADLESSFQAPAPTGFGADVAIGPEDPIGIIIGIASNAIYEVWEEVEAAYYSFSIDNAVGPELDRLVAFKGLVREVALQAIVTIIVTGNNGVVITVGSLIVQTAQGVQFVNESSGTISGSNVSLTFRAVVAGPAGNVATNSINQIVTPIPGVTGINNPSQAIGGAAIESDSALRLRYKQGAAFGGSSVSALQAVLQQIEGIISARVSENTGDAPDSNNHPPHSYNAIIEGVDSANQLAVFNAFLMYSPAGIASSGAQSITFPDNNGQSKTYNYDTPTPVNIYVNVNIVTGLTGSVLTAWETQYQNLIMQAIIQAVGGSYNGISYAGAGLGANIYAWQIVANIAANGVTGFNSIAVTVGLSPSPTGSVTNVAYNQYGLTDSTTPLATINID